MSKTDIHYLSSLPGVGKTKLAVKMMRKHLRGDDGVIFYVAPTIDLLVEVRGNIEKGLDKALKKKVRLVVGNDSGRSVQLRVSKLMSGHKSEEERVRRIPGGGILLMTHEGFLTLEDELPRKDETTVIFDEARKFTAKMKPIKLASDKERRMFARLVEENSTPLLDRMDRETGFQKFSLDEWPRNLKQMTESSASRKKYAELYEVVESATNFRTDLYVRASSANSNYHFYEVIIPSRVFDGFKNVILMAAFLEDSQMWHLLQNSSQIRLRPLHRLEGWEHCQFMFNEANRKILERFAKVCIFPLTRQTTPLSMTRMNNAILVPTNRKDEIKLHLEGLGIESTRDLIDQAKRMSERDPTKAEKSALKYLKQFGAKFDSFVWYLKAANKFIESLKEDGKVEDRVLVVVNDRNAKYTDTKYPDWLRISSVSHGLNKFMSSNTIVFAAALNPEPDLAILYRALLPGYDFTKDHLADSCVQSVTRLCVRDTDSEVVAYVILPDSAMAELLRQKMLDEPSIVNRAAHDLNMTALSTLNVRRTRVLLSEEERQIRRKKSNEKKSVKWRAEDHNKKLASLRASRSRFKRLLDAAHPDKAKSFKRKLLEVQERIDNLVSKRNAAKEHK